MMDGSSHINGVVVSKRRNGKSKLAVWVKSSEDTDEVLRICDRVRKSLSSHVRMEYFDHKEDLSYEFRRDLSNRVN